MGYKSLVIHKTDHFCWVTKENSDEVLMKMNNHDVDVLNWAIKYLGLRCKAVPAIGEK